jgi:hypothetical protein
MTIPENAQMAKSEDKFVHVPKHCTMKAHNILSERSETEIISQVISL